MIFTLCLIGAFFGSVKNKQSYTQIEFKYAKEKKKPILAFLLDDKQSNAIRRKLDNKDKERRHDQDIENFKNEAKQIKPNKQRIVDFFQIENIEKYL